MPYANPFSLAGKTALVAGASRGIGEAIAVAMAHAGARTILASRSLDKLEKIAAGLRDEGLDAIAAPLDITSPESREALVAAHPEIDILANVAGMNIRKRFVDYTPEEYSHILNQNLTGIFALTQAVGRGMIGRGRGGKVIFIGSLTSLMGLPYVSVYTITKTALAGLTRNLAAEWGGHDIQVNCIAPGFILTDLNRDMWQPAEMHQWLKGTQANPKLGRPEHIAPLAVFLAAPASDYITGQVIAADGGNSTTRIWPFTP
jgi:NAD(P)-dependent dehydrogenase (short-subunit alcohol dehydrogenase family)